MPKAAGPSYLQGERPGASRRRARWPASG